MDNFIWHSLAFLTPNNTQLTGNVVFSNRNALFFQPVICRISYAIIILSKSVYYDVIMYHAVLLRGFRYVVWPQNSFKMVEAACLKLY